jgi:hypothetical protein
MTLRIPGVHPIRNMGEHESDVPIIDARIGTDPAFEVGEGRHGRWSAGGATRKSNCATCRTARTRDNAGRVRIGAPWNVPCEQRQVRQHVVDVIVITLFVVIRLGSPGTVGHHRSIVAGHRAVRRVRSNGAASTAAGCTINSIRASNNVWAGSIPAAAHPISVTRTGRRIVPTRMPLRRD